MPNVQVPGTEWQYSLIAFDGKGRERAGMTGMG